MARTFFSAANTSAQALTAATAKTALQLKAPTSQRIAVQQISVSFDDTVNTDKPVTVKVLRQTTAGTQSGAAATIKAKDNDIATAVQSTVLDGYTVEPTLSDVLWTGFVHPQTGIIIPLPIPGELIIAGGGRLGVQCTAPNNVNVLVTLEGEE